MSIFDQAYDEMSIQEVCYRLPGELATRALKRRITDLPTLLDFIKTVGSQPTFVEELKTHINGIMSVQTVPDILSTFDQGLHQSLFGWLNDTNKDRIKNEGRSSLSTKFLFNLADGKDLDDLKQVIDNLLKEPTIRPSAVLSVLDKSNSTVFPQLMDIVIKDTRPEVRECILSVSNQANSQLISDHQRTIGLKAFVKSTQKLPYVGIQNFKIFTILKPKERMTALSKYFDYFKPFRKSQVFSLEPTQEEFDMILFAGCIEHNELVNNLSNRYKEISELDPPPVLEDKEDDNI